MNLTTPGISYKNSHTIFVFLWPAYFTSHDCWIKLFSYVCPAEILFLEVSPEINEVGVTISRLQLEKPRWREGKCIRDNWLLNPNLSSSHALPPILLLLAEPQFCSWFTGQLCIQGSGYSWPQDIPQLVWINPSNFSSFANDWFRRSAGDKLWAHEAWTLMQGF